MQVANTRQNQGQAVLILSALAIPEQISFDTIRHNASRLSWHRLFTLATPKPLRHRLRLSSINALTGKVLRYNKPGVHSTKPDPPTN